MVRNEKYDRPSGLKQRGNVLGKLDVKQIPDASQQLTQKSHENIKKYVMFGIVIYFLCC